MSAPRPLFVCGLARGGTNLLARMLGAHPGADVLLDPWFPFYRSLRNAALRRGRPARDWKDVRPDSPLQDYYFTEERIAALDLVQSASLDLPFEPGELAQLRGQIAARAGLESPDLAPRLDEMRGTTYREVFRSLLAIAGSVRGRGQGWLAIKEVWTVEFLPLLARAFPEARFVVVLRDPRAVVCSMLGFEKIDPTQVANVLSYARHWRKYVAFLIRFRESFPAGRLFLLTFETLVADPESAAGRLCAFLGLDFHPNMTDPAAYGSGGGPWLGNSTHGRFEAVIDPTAATRWRGLIAEAPRAMVEMVCGPDMALLDFPLDGRKPGRAGAEELAAFVQLGRRPCSWRSDLGDPLLDYACELFRLKLLEHGARGADSGLVRRAFLFEEVLDALGCGRKLQQGVF